ncbi:MAG: transposase [Patescibacteria group bacterium]|nr:transposase [Patescibacteria group bacterium]
MKKTILANNEYYHVFNRGVEKRNIFTCDHDYMRFLISMKEFNRQDPVVSLYRLSQPSVAVRPLQTQRKLVEIACYCLNPNHFHLILKQISDGGISEFLKRLQGGYTGYFNYRYKRSGVLFQGKFKSVRVKTNAHLLYLSAYVNRNYFIHGYGDNSDWPYSSLWDYIGKRNSKICDKDVILNKFKDKKDYQKFTQENALYMKEKKEDEELLLE